MADTVVSTITVQNGGRTYDIQLEHPRDATDEQISAYAQQQVKSQFPETAYPSPQINRPKPESFLQGVEQGVALPLYNLARIGQAIGNAIGIEGNDVNRAQAAFNAEQESRETQGSAAGRFAGEVAGTLPTAMLPGGAFVQGAAGGALLTNARDPIGVGIDAVLGGAGGAAGSLALRGAARLANPTVSNDVRTLMNEGVRVTTGQAARSVNPGEIAGAGGTFGRVEDIASSIPVAGAGVRNAQYRGVQDLNRAAVNRALRPIGEKAPPDLAVGQDMVRYAGDRLGAAYNDVLPRLNGEVDEAFANRIRAITARADVPIGYQDRLQDVVNEALKAFRPKNDPVGGNTVITAEQFAQLPPTRYVFDGRRLRDASERLGDIGAAWRASNDPYERYIGDAAAKIREQLHALARRQNPEAAGRLRDIDRGYASLVRVERAAQGTADGVFTPKQYDAAVRMSDRSARRRMSARGQALDQELSGAASRVMANTAAQGGSKDVNSIIAASVLGTRALGGDPWAIAGVGGALGGTAAYSRIGQDVINGIVNRQNYLSPQLAGLLEYGARGAPVAIPSLMDQNR